MVRWRPRRGCRGVRHLQRSFFPSTINYAESCNKFLNLHSKLPAYAVLPGLGSAFFRWFDPLAWAAIFRHMPPSP
jgi:hypothetical protein